MLAMNCGGCSHPCLLLTRRSSFTEVEGIVRDLIYELGDLLDDELEDQHSKMMA